MSISEDAIERLNEFPEQFAELHRDTKMPVIISGAAANWPASRWTPETLAAEFGNQETSATIQLPESGVVYLETEKAHRRTLKLSEFTELMESGAPCYIDQADLSMFPGLADACLIDTLDSAGASLRQSMDGSADPLWPALRPDGQFSRANLREKKGISCSTRRAHSALPIRRQYQQEPR